MLDESSSFSRARALLPGATVRGSASTGTGEAFVFAGDLVGSLLGEIARQTGIEVVAGHVEPGRPGRFDAWPSWLDHRVVRALKRAGQPSAYAHQAQALARIASGEHVVVATPTASGKSRVYQTAVLHACLRDPAARALWIFPTKALARDQVEAFRRLVEAAAAGSVGICTYDGDTPRAERQAARSRAAVVTTNPDMLHRSLLPQHDRWAHFLSGLRYVVVDELHVYRGIFGSHVAWVLRRLLRLCGRYGAQPQVVACSATVANPKEHAERLVGRPFAAVCDDAAPTGPRHHLVVRPKLLDPRAGVRKSHVEATRKVAGVFRRAGVPTLVFCRTRRRVELLTRYLREDEARDRAAAPGAPQAARGAALSAVRGYRGGYLPQRRREVERDLRKGRAKLVVATSALELGMDVGGLDAVVLSGYPGSVAAARQRLGRAGRRGAPAVAVVVLGGSARDNLVAGDPAVLWRGRVEAARIDPENPRVVLAHLRCAAFEAPLTRACARTLQLPEDDLAAAADRLVALGALVRRNVAGEPVHLHVGPGFPADGVDLRGPMEEDFVVLDTTGGADPQGDVLARVDYEDAPLYLHEGAIYPIEGETFEVRRLDWEGRKAYVRRVRADYYTEAVTRLRIKVLGPSGPPRTGPGGAPRAGAVFVVVLRQVPGFKKIRFRTHETVGYGPVALPDLEYETTACFLSPPVEALCAALPDAAVRGHAVMAAAHLLRHAAAFVCMCDAADLGAAVVDGVPGAVGAGWAEALSAVRRPGVDAQAVARGRPSILLYDRRPGGAGLATGACARLAEVFDRAGRLLDGCGCAGGCPACLGPGGVWDPSGEVGKEDVADRGASSAKRAARVCLATLGAGVGCPLPTGRGGGSP